MIKYFLQGVSSLPDYVSFKIFPGTPLEHIFSAAGDDLLELLQGFFTFNPLCRTTATQVLHHYTHEVLIQPALLCDLMCCVHKVKASAVFQIAHFC